MSQESVNIGSDGTGASGVDAGNPVLGTQPIGQMTDREIAEETLYWLREAGSALVKLQEGGIGGMMKMVMGR